MLHYMVDAYDTIQDQTNSMRSVNECLVTVAENLKLRPVMPPFLLPYYYSENYEDGGISAFMFFEGGHITIHTFPLRACYFVDVLSNDFFSAKKAEELILGAFSAKEVHPITVDRRLVDSLPEARPDTNADFGPHYMIQVDDVDLTFEGIYQWLDQLPPRINMEAITRPYVIYSTIQDPAYISGIILVAQSHIAVHYDIKARQAYIDIFSCSFLKEEQINQVLEEAFHGKAKCKLIVRGSKHHYSIKNDEERIHTFKTWQTNKAGSQ
ncbi:MAG: S-adenosylmethionine decarboxylase [Bacilli bacterium]|nr:S-adenosylmethionine decarboxylase [Bacilli bacterium]